MPFKSLVLKSVSVTDITTCSFIHRVKRKQQRQMHQNSLSLTPSVFNPTSHHIPHRHFPLTDLLRGTLPVILGFWGVSSLSGGWGLEGGLSFSLSLHHADQCMHWQPFTTWPVCKAKDNIHIAHSHHAQLRWDSISHAIKHSLNSWYTVVVQHCLTKYSHDEHIPHFHALSISWNQTSRLRLCTR